MQSSLVVRMTENRQAHGWLHKANGAADTLIVLCHGHNSTGDRGRFITLARWFEHAGQDCIRWNAVRNRPRENTFTVLTVTEEYEQVKALLDPMRRKYKRIIAIGHSQGALLALKLCAEGIAHTYVSLMGVGDTVESLERKKQALAVQHAPDKDNQFIILPNGQTFEYTNMFFTDFVSWDVPKLLSLHRGASLFIAAEQDTAIPPSEVRNAFKQAHEPKNYLTVDDVHNFSEETSRLIAHAIRDWLQTE